MQNFRKFFLCLSFATPLLYGQMTGAPIPPQPGQLATAYAPLDASDKLRYRTLQIIAPQALTAAALATGVEQIAHSPREWGQGVEGYSKRYASTLGGIVVRQTLNFGLESALREDPRYFPLDVGSKKARFGNAVKQTFVTRTDSGSTTFAYGRIASAFATGQISRAWLPPSNDSMAYGFRIGGIGIGVDAAVNVLYEFIPSTRPK